MITLRNGSCDQDGCSRSGDVIAKVLPQSGRWCDRCNKKRLDDARVNKGHRNRSDVKMKLDKTNEKWSVKGAIKALDAAFSPYMRKLFADEQGIVSCITCGIEGHWKEFDLGHCFPRGNWAIRWDPKNTGAQCRACNSTPDGERDKFKLYIDKTWGAGTVEELEQKRNAPHKLNIIELRELLKKITNETDN